MPDDIGADLAIQGVEYGRRTVHRLYTFPVIVHSLDEERRVCDWLMKQHNWRLLNRADAPGGWVLNFTFTETIADTDRGDKVCYDRRWEVKDA